MRIFLADINPYIQNKTFMKIFLAGSEQRADGMLRIARDCYKGANILQSFFYVNEITEKFVLPESADFMLDSGAFTFITKNKDNAIDWNDYIERYAEFINKNSIKKYFELDIDSITGYESVKYLRQKLEKLTNKQSIPVWHPSRGYAEFIRLCDEYPYIAVGGIVIKEISINQYKAFPKLISEAHKRGTKIHGLGFTRLSELHKYHFDSVDSSAWVTGNKFGYLYKFENNKLIKIDTPPGHRLADSNKVAVHNFNEWKKYYEWAETHL